MPSAETVDVTLVEGLLMSRTLPGRSSRVLTAHGHDLAGHVRRVVAGEEHDDVRDLPRLGRPTERLLRGQLGEQLVAGHLGEEQVHRDRRRDGIDAYAELRRLDSRG